MLSAVAISLVVAVVTMLAVSWVISHQYHAQANALLGKAAGTIDDSLAEIKNNQLSASRQLATQKNIGSTIWYLAKYAKSNIDQEMLFVTYQQLAMDAHRIGHVANLSKVAIYDITGSLVAFALFDQESERVGFAEYVPAQHLEVATLKAGEEVSRKNLGTMRATDGIGFKFGGDLPRQENVHYAQVDGMLVLEGHVPIMGEVFNPGTGQQETRQVGLVVTVKPLGSDFVDHLSRLTDTRINVFTARGFSSGNVAAYRHPDWNGVPQADAEVKTAAVRFNEIVIEGESFYQGLMPLYHDDQLVGTIASLHSKDTVSRNIREMMQILGAIAIASLLLIFPFAWYFSSSISRPLTVLSAIFRSVAGGKQSEAQRGELHLLEIEKERDDELGDLTQSFIAMDNAVNQKIRQIEQINASLEQTIKDRTEALIASEQESRTLLQNTPDTIARYDRECRRIYVNAAFCAATEGGLDALLGKKPSEYPGGANAKVYETKIHELFLTGENTQFELKWPGKNGREICSHIRLTAERDSSGKIVSVLGVGCDITELNEYRTELNRKDQAKTRFLAAAGHDLRQPLAAASLFIDALKYAGTTPEQHKIIHRLDMAMSTFNGLLDALLNVSKLDAGGVKPVYAAIDVVEIFNWLEQSFAPMALEKKIRFGFYFSMKEPLRVRTDIDLVKSVLMNFVSNAIKFTSKGGILISARRRGENVLFQVWDTGIGIADQYMEHIFDEFYQIDNPQRDRTRGLGLGLSIAQRAISLLGGELTCRSRVGRGTVFEFRLPLVEAKNEIPEQASAEESPEEVNLSAFVRGKRFVVVEDDVLVSEALNNVLETLGGEVVCFYRAEDALNHPDIGHADYYVVDYMLGGTLNGIQFLNQLRQQMVIPPVAVLMTGDTSPAFMREMPDCVWPVLHKPANLASLVSSLGAQSSGA